MPKRTCSNCKQTKPGVKLCADDLLCPDCDAANENKLVELRTRTEQTSQSRTSNTRNKQLKKNPTSANSPSVDFPVEPMSGAPEGFAAAAAADLELQQTTTQPKTSYPTVEQNSSVATVLTTTDVSMEHQLASLRAEIQRQQSTMSLLQTQLSAVLSLLGIAEHDIEPANHEDDKNSSTLVNNANRATDQSSWSTVVAKKKMQKSTKNFQQSLIAAVYNDQTESKRRASSFIISGLSEDQQLSDAEQFLNLCRDEFNMQPAVVITKRLGRVQPNKSRLLLVVTRKADQAQQLITAAKQLRKSANQSVRDNIYISRNLTKAEADAAYQSRVRRRQAAARINDMPAVPQAQAGRNDALQFNQTNHINDISASLSLLTVASNPHAIIFPPSTNQSLQQPIDTAPMPMASRVDERQSGRQATWAQQ
jgi:hypothetical protein